MQGQPDAQVSNPLIGRDYECGLLDELVEAVAEGLSGSLVLVGEPGIGKSALIDYVSSSAVEVVRLVGIESQFSIEFAALNRVLMPFRHHLGELPTPQREALLTALEARSETPPAKFLVGLATLALLASASKRAPVIFCIDDAQWIDHESLEIFGFVARRAHAEGLGFLFATRESGTPLPMLSGLPTHPVLGLEPAASLALLRRAQPTGLSPLVAARIVADSGGNPLAMVEVLLLLTPEQLAGRSALPEQLPSVLGLASHFLRQLQGLSQDTRSLLVLASSMLTDDSTVLWRAAGLLGLPPDAADDAETRGIVAIGDTVEFRHPLIRSAVYQAAEPAQRHSAHRAIAAVAQQEHSDDIASWHLAAATAQPDEELAANLERFASRAERRGGHLARARFLARAADLSPADGLRGERTFAAARAYLDAGDGVMAEALLQRAIPWLTASGRQVDILRTRALLAMFHQRFREAYSLLLRAIAIADPSENELTRVLLFEALRSALGADGIADRAAARRIAEAALSFVRSTAATGSVRDLLLEGLSTRFAEGYSQALPLFRRAVARMFAEEDAALGAHTSPVAGWFAADEIWDAEGRLAMFERGIAAGHQQGALHVVHVSLAGLSISQCWAGEMVRAEQTCYQSIEVEALMDVARPRRIWPLIHILAWQGREEECRDNARTAEDLGNEWGSLYMEMFAWSGLTILELGLGNYDEALGWALRVFDRDVLGFGSTILPEVVEAAARVGEAPAAQAAIARLSERAQASGTPWAMGMLARSQALVAPAAQAESYFVDAIAILAITPMRVELARAHLLFGEWLRRQKRRREAKRQLLTALEMFRAMGVAGFAARARSELVAIGADAAELAADAAIRSNLTRQEARIAELAASGATNPEIAKQLFLSSSTVEFHLTKIYRKLAISSRKQLADAIAR